ncbi:MAG: GNAT family N-acetyltransferase [Prevotellaceae bacterium]|nr:GNAT family N-acetyltransferase [Prevotellaceae bacterium]
MEHLYFDYRTRRTTVWYKCWFEVVNDRLDVFVKVRSSKESDLWCILEEERLQTEFRQQFHELINDCELRRRKIPVHIRLQDDVPPVISANAMPHQRRAVEFFSTMKVGALIGDTGVGKSKIAIDLADSRYAAGQISKVLVFSPCTARSNFYNQIVEHCPASELEWKILGIESMSSSDATYLDAIHFADAETMIIVDESDLCKTHDAIRSERIHEVCRKSTYKLIMTATPVTDNVHNLYMQYTLLSPYIFDCKNWYQFENMFVIRSGYNDEVVGYKNLDYMVSLIEPYTMQIRKEECMTLPDKTFTTLTCPLTDNQQAYYDDTKERLLELINSGDYTAETIFLHLTRLQQIACGYLHSKRSGYEYLGTNKFKLLDELLNDTEQYIFFCKYLFEIDLLRDYLGDDCAVFTGENPKERDAELRRFTAGKTRFFIATTSAGGRALNGLQVAHNLIYFSNSFKWGEKIHSLGRVDRKGQTQSMKIFNLLTEAGIDFKIMKNLERKSSLDAEVRSILNDKEKLRTFVRELGHVPKYEITMKTDIITQTEILKGTSAKLYKIVAPFAMSKKIVAEFENYPMLTDDNYLWFIIKEDMNLLGFAAIRRLASHVEFTNDYVLPAYRKKNIHKKLIAERVKWCRENKVECIKADCTNACLSQYKKAGFKILQSYVKWHKVELTL